jgi:integrase
MTEDMQVRNLSPHTQASYLQQVSLFARYFRLSPDALTPEHIRTYQIYLTNEKRLAPNSIHTAVAALRFLYRITLKKDWTFGEDIPLPKKAAVLPVVLSPEEVVHFLSCVDCSKHRVILTTCYAAGLRISETVRLKASAIAALAHVARAGEPLSHAGQQFRRVRAGDEPSNEETGRRLVRVERGPAAVRVCRHLDDLQWRPRHQVQADPRPASGLRLPDDCGQRGGRANSFEGDAGDPDDRRGARHLDARALGRGESLQRPLPDDKLSIVMRGAEKEDKTAA